jgi:tetratricopeptide (TPR) repeat protein
VTEDKAEQKKLLAKREQYILDAASLDKNNALFQMAVAYLYHQRGDLDKALEKYQHVLEIDDRLGESYFNMADIYRQKNQPAKQMEMYQTLIAKNPGFKNAHLQLGRMYESQGKLDDAIREYIEEVNLDKSNELALQILGAALYRRNDWVNVSKVYHRLSVIKPDNSRYYLLHAQAAAKIGNLQEALEALEAAQVLTPGDAQLAQNIRNIRNILNPPKKAAASGPLATPVQ